MLLITGRMLRASTVSVWHPVWWSHEPEATPEYSIPNRGSIKIKKSNKQAISRSLVKFSNLLNEVRFGINEK